MILSRENYLLKIDGAAYSGEACKALEAHDAEIRRRVMELECFYGDFARKGEKYAYVPCGTCEICKLKEDMK